MRIRVIRAATMAEAMRRLTAELGPDAVLLSSRRVNGGFEATAALDGPSKIAFHQAIKTHCPDVTVISVMHETAPPRSATGESFYDSVLRVAGGVATKHPIEPVLAEMAIPFPEKRPRRRVEPVRVPAE